LSDDTQLPLPLTLKARPVERVRPLPDNAQVHVDGLGLNDRITIYADQRDPDAGNASHKYRALMDEEGGFGSLVADVSFQHGPRDVEGSTSGITDAVLLAILLDRFKGFQAGPFACRENALVITKLEEAHQWMRERAWTRHRQGVLGKNLKHTS